MFHNDRIMSIYFVAVVFVCIRCMVAERMVNVTIPRWVRSGTEEVILRCDYEYSDNEEKFVVKWFVDEDRTSSYQWIPSVNSRSFSKMFQSYVNWNYYDENGDKYTKYRNIVLNRPNAKFSGTYKCVVSSNEDNGESIGTMTVYKPAKRLEISYKEDDDTVEILCEADGLYPKPEITLLQQSPQYSYPILLNDTYTRYCDDEDDNDDDDDDDDEKNSYCLKTSIVIPKSALESEEHTVFKCVILIADKTDCDNPIKVYRKEESVKFHPDKENVKYSKMQKGESPDNASILSTSLLLMIGCAFLAW